jgi:SAM-dependent methyltransferase
MPVRQDALLTRDMPYDGRKSWDALYDPDNDHALWGADPAPYVVNEVAALWRQDGARDILALPSGDGRNILPLLAEFPGILAADSSPNALELLAKRCAHQGLKAPRSSVQDVYAPTFGAASFDSILCWDVLSHLERPREAIASLFKLLKPGGSFIANVFAEDDPSLRDDSMHEISHNVLANKEGIVYWLYDANMTQTLASAQSDTSIETQKIEWREDPHPGYRDYEHTHLGYVMILRKTIADV